MEFWKILFIICLFNLNINNILLYYMRLSPEQSATLFKVGHKAKGNDNNIWIVVQIGAGIKRWQRFNPHPKGKRYYTHDNGGRPYLVIIYKDLAYIYECDIDKYTNKCTYDTLIKKYTIVDKYIGKDTRGHIGNSIILQLSSTKFVFVGNIVYEFYIKDKIIKYYSFVGNSDVPYPVLVGEKNVYFMLDKTFVDKKHFYCKNDHNKKINWEQAYDLYYGVRKHMKYTNGKTGIGKGYTEEPLSKYADKVKHKIINKPKY
jgi:hypothetical protein